VDPMTRPEDKSVADIVEHESRHEPGDHKVPGTMVLVLILLLAFVVYYFANWKALADVWHVR
jgi:hypothetical protein